MLMRMMAVACVLMNVIMPSLLQAKVDEALGVTVGDVKLIGRIEGSAFSFTLDAKAAVAKAGAILPLVAGDVVLDEIIAPKTGASPSLDGEKKLYSLELSAAGEHTITASFAARALSQEGGLWREVTIDLPPARMRSIELTCDRTDLEVLLPGALKVERKVVEGKLTITALLSPGVPFVARWKPQVQQLESKLVFATEANTIATVTAGAMKIDTLFEFIVSQGKMNDITFLVPANLSITQVRGSFIRDWQIKAAAEAGKPSTLTVALNRPQTGRYGVQIISESVLTAFPTQADVAVIEPVGGIRAGGSVMVGTNSAIALVVRKSGGLSQVNTAAFPRMLLNKDEARAIPAAKSFSFTHATMPYQMSISLADIVPTYDTTQVIVASVSEEDLILEGRLDLEVRDAPLRDLVLELPAGFVVADVSGQMVEEFTLHPVVADGAATRTVDVRFKQPVLGRTVISYKLELGKGPLASAQSLQGFAVRGAAIKRSFIVIAADQGVSVDAPTATNLREMNTAAVPVRVAGAQYAYSFRDGQWLLGFTARKKPAAIRVESFHLVTLSERIAYGNIAFNYAITGSPIDEFSFRIPSNLEFIDIVGRDVRSVSIDPVDKAIRRVKIGRKVIGDYTLGMTFTLKYKDGDTIEVGSIQCEGADVQTQTGYIAIASHLNLEVEPQTTTGSEIRAIEPEELPENYQLLVTAPLLKTFTFIKPPHSQKLKVSSFDRVSLLPVVIEVTDIRTDIYANETGSTESRTTVRYRIKNSSNQFLPLSMPRLDGVKVWRTRVGTTVVEGNRVIDRLTPVTASLDPKNNLLMIPLPRHANPNEPITVEVEYGADHGELGWSGEIMLEGPTTDPRNAVSSTFTSWTVAAPVEWAVLLGGSDLLPQPREQRHGGLGAVMNKVVSAWGFAVSEWGRAFGGDSVLHIGGGIVLLTICFLALGLAWLIFCAQKRPRALPMAASILALTVLLGFGLLAAAAPNLRSTELGQDDLSMITLTRTVTMTADQPATITASIVPQWRQHASFFGGMVVPILAIFVLVLIALPMVRQKYAIGPVRWLLITVLAIVALLSGIAQFHPFVPAIAHLFTWGIPAILVSYFCWRSLIRPAMWPASSKRSQGGAVAAMLVFIMMLTGGYEAAAQANDSVLAIAPREPVLDRVEAALTADGDHVEVVVSLRVTATEATRTLLMNQSPIVLTPDDANAPVRIEAQGGKYYLVISKAGTFDATFKFLSPLLRDGEDQVRTFGFPLPLALTNRVSLIIPTTGLDVHVDRAMRMTKEENGTNTIVYALLGPGDDVAVSWKPRARETSQEKTSFYSQVISAIRLDASLVEARHIVKFQIAQGELREVRLRIPAPMSVTSVQGRSVGAWRYDPAKQELEVRLSEPATGEYAMAVVTQASQEKLPYEVALAPIVVLDAVRHTGIMGLLVSSTVQATVSKAPATMNVDDFTREADNLLRTYAGYDPAAPGAVRYAYRTLKADDAVIVQAVEVKPELRVDEQATFAVTDDRLIYNGMLMLDVTKAGVFSVELKLPSTLDIDTLTAPPISHWDDSVEAGVRTVIVHFKEKFQGQVPLKLEMSRQISGLPPRIDAPRVTVVGAIKHTGQIVVAADRGVRMSIAQRDGVSELNPLEMGIRDAGTLVFKMLKPDWALVLATEVIEPRITVEFLHVAKVSEGLVRHTHHLMYSLANAGTKVFEFQIPPGAEGVFITGPDIARRDEIEKGSGRYRVELNRKWYDRPYPLTVSYDTKYALAADDNNASGRIVISPVKAIGADQQRGHIAVLSTPRVQLTEYNRSAALQLAEPRTIPGSFTTRQLASAAFCFASATPEYSLSLNVQRHQAADLQQADALSTNIHTVVAFTGDSLTRVRMLLRVGSKQHLEATIPPGTRVWTLLVNGRSTIPSMKKGAAGGDVLLIPLGGASGGMEVNIEFVYATPAPSDWSQSRPSFVGPQFDLPLKKITWQLHVPEQFTYDDFQGTLKINEEQLETAQVDGYALRDYDAQVYSYNLGNDQIAKQAQVAGEQLLREGDQRRAQHAFEAAVNYSQFSEDARVKLHEFNKDNALVGLVGARQRLRDQADGNAAPNASGAQRIDTETIGRIKGSLSKADSDNLSDLTRIWTDQQAKAAGETVQLAVNMPSRGRLLTFERSVQVKDRTPMVVSFAAEPIAEPQATTTRWWFLALLIGLSGLYGLVAVVSRRWTSLPEAMKAPEVSDAEENDEAAAGE